MTIKIEAGRKEWDRARASKSKTRGEGRGGGTGGKENKIAKRGGERENRSSTQHARTGISLPGRNFPFRLSKK